MLFRVAVPLLLLVLISSCERIIKFGDHNGTDTTDTPPLAISFSPSNGTPQAESTITLSYIDLNGDLANSCSVSNLSNLTETTTCSCNIGVCTVGVTGIGNYTGVVSFDFTVTANGVTSNTATASFNLIAVPFVSVWRTTAPSESITLPLRIGFTYNATVDWGDGSTADITAWNDPDITHVYASAGDHTVTISGTFETISFNNGGDKLKLISIPDLGNVGWTSFESAFNGCSNLTTVSGGNTSQVVSMANMFTYATSATPDTSGWDTSHVTTMNGMFYSASAANPDVSGWNTSNVTNMNQLFTLAASANPDVSQWDMSKVTTINSMFYSATSAYPDVSAWDTSSITSMSAVFAYSNANPDVSAWDTSHVTTMGTMFYGATNAVPDVSQWNTSNVTDMSYMFCFATSANPDVSNWNVSAVTNMTAVFYGASSATPNTSAWNTSNVTKMDHMFQGATVANPDVSGWNVANVTNMSYMFREATAANPDMSNWNFANVTNMSFMFNGVTLPTVTYSNMLNRINATSAQNNVTLHGGSSLYNAGSAAARANLVGRGWVITDGGAE